MERNTEPRILGTMLDCSRNAVVTIDCLKQWIDLTADIGYNMLMLYTEDTYEVKNEPYFGYMRGRYTQQELRELDRYAQQKHMTLMPCIQTLAHLHSIKRWPQYFDHFDTDDILLIGDERVYELIDHMFASIADAFTCRTVHVGMDEAELVGRGKYYDAHGDCDRTQILLSHLKRVCQIAKKYGFRCLMWSDMFFKLASGGEYAADAKIREGVGELIPDNMELVYWDYASVDRQHYDAMLKAHEAIKPGTWFGGGLWKWTGYAPHNGFTLRATRAALDSCRENGVQKLIMTMWGDDGGECSPFAVLPSLFYAAELARGETDDEAIKQRFEAHFGVPFDTFMLLDLAGTKNARDDVFSNPNKYLLFNDPFTGLMDETVDDGEGAQFGACAALLEAHSSMERWGYLFQTLASLCRVLEYKAELGKKTRAAYHTKDREAVRALLPVYDETLARLQTFYETYQAQWMRENKPHGFDVQDLRLGGLMQRLKSCRSRLEAYADGGLSRIDELEEQQLDFFDGYKRIGFPLITHWGAIATANVAYVQHLGY